MSRGLIIFLSSAHDLVSSANVADKIDYEVSRESMKQITRV